MGHRVAIMGGDISGRASAYHVEALGHEVTIVGSPCCEVVEHLMPAFETESGALPTGCACG